MISRHRNLFHILTIGASKHEHEMYGFHRGCFVSPHHVAETIRGFVAYFFSCKAQSRFQMLLTIKLPLSYIAHIIYLFFHGGSLPSQVMYAAQTFWWV